jgi:antitoxin (DNA-binding transcriptional repressor) of toxin-antitoxin stability system
MKVSAQYAETHFPDVYQAAEKGEEIVIARPGKPNLVLVPQPDPAPEKAARIPRRELLGVGEGLVHVPDEEEWRAIKRAFAADMPDFSPLADEPV